MSYYSQRHFLRFTGVQRKRNFKTIMTSVSTYQSEILLRPMISIPSLIFFSFSVTMNAKRNLQKSEYKALGVRGSLYFISILAPLCNAINDIVHHHAIYIFCYLTYFQSVSGRLYTSLLSASFFFYRRHSSQCTQLLLEFTLELDQTWYVY